MNPKALLVATALTLALSAVSCGKDDGESSASIAYGVATRTTIPEEKKEEEETTEKVSDAETVEMPDVTNMRSDLASDILSMLGLVCEIRNSPDMEVPEGNVISTEPEADTKVNKGETIILYVSMGVEISVDDYVGQVADDAVALAEYAGLKPVTEFKDSDGEKGKVIEQSIEKDTIVDAGTEIIFYISN